MLCCGERLSSAVRSGSRAPSSCSLTTLSLALRLVVVRGLATCNSDNAGGLGTAWLVASGSCGYGTTSPGRRWHSEARPGPTSFATRLQRYDVDGHHYQHHRHCQYRRGYGQGYDYGVSQGHREGVARKRMLVANLVTNSASGSVDGGDDASHAGGGVGVGVDGISGDGDGAGVGVGVGVGGVVCGDGAADVVGVRQNGGGGCEEGADKAGGTSHGTGGPKMLRLTKILADRAVGTRSEVDAMVRRGRIKVDGKVVRSPKTKLPVNCVIELNGQECAPVPLLVAYHKPRGVITSLNDDWDRTDLSSVLPKSLLRKHHPVGRLDGDTSGLLLFSSDGALTHRLLSPRFSVEREYYAKVEVPVSGEEPGRELVSALKEGVTTADGVYKADVPGIDGRTVRVVVREGKNRMVRRMLANAGYPVLELRRERYGKITLGDLPEGEHAPVSGEALEWARLVLAGAGAAVEASNGSDKEEGDGSLG